MRAFVSAALVAALAGCGSTQKFGDHPELTAGRAAATVNVARANSPIGSALTAPIHIDRYRVGYVGPGGSISVKVPAGRRVIAATMGDTVFEIAPGSTAYFEAYIESLMWLHTPDIGVKPITPGRWRQLVGEDR